MTDYQWEKSSGRLSIGSTTSFGGYAEMAGGGTTLDITVSPGGSIPTEGVGGGVLIVSGIETDEGTSAADDLFVYSQFANIHDGASSEGVAYVGIIGTPQIALTDTPSMFCLHYDDSGSGTHIIRLINNMTKAAYIRWCIFSNPNLSADIS